MKKLVIGLFALGFLGACAHAAPRAVWCEFPLRTDGVSCVIEMEDSCWMAICETDGMCELVKAEDYICSGE